MHLTHRSILLVVFLLSVFSYRSPLLNAAIAENLNPLQKTLYYGVENSKVHIKICPSIPATNLDLSHCQPLKSRHATFEPMTLDQFESRAKRWAEVELAKIKQTLETAGANLEKAQRLLDAVRAILEQRQLDAEDRTNYLEREKDLKVQAEALAAQTELAQNQLKGFDSLFGENGYLAQELIHPLAAGENTYNAVRPYVRRFYEAFKYQYGDPITPLLAARHDFAQFANQGRNPYCLYWRSGAGPETSVDAFRQTIIRTFVSLNEAANFPMAKVTCEAAGMDLPAAEHGPGYHSHMWQHASSPEENWPSSKSAKLFSVTPLASSLPEFDFLNRKLKIFWAQNLSVRNYGKMDAFFLTADGDWFHFNETSPTAATPMTPSVRLDPNWKLSVVCEKQYMLVPRFIEDFELPECARYVGIP